MYADQATEHKLVQAIKEAAQRIDYSSPEDPEAILADCLTKKGLHDGFAKTAANAINKSYSVYYMSTHDDTDRDADHRLLDGDKVKMHMAKEDVPACPHTSKPVESPVIVEVKRITPVSKAASENKAEYTPRTFKSDVEYLDWLSNGLCKFASAFDRFYADTCMATERIYGRHKQAREMDMDDYTVQCIMSHNHRDTNELLETLGHTKKTTKVAMFGTGKVQELPRIIPDNETSATIFALVRDASIIKTAHNSVDYILKEAGELKDCLCDIISEYEAKCLTKTAAPSTGPKMDLGTAAGNTISFVPSLAVGALSGVSGGLANILENAATAAGDPSGVASSSVLDTQLLKEDRRVKNLEAWAEVASDEDLARYPITDLFEVTQKLIKANPQFERPDAAPMLIDTVKQVMAQGGQIGLAMHGATAKTLSDIAKARSNITGNDLYGIRNTITSVKEPGKVFNIAKLFTEPATTAMTSLETAVPKLTNIVPKGIINSIEAVHDWKANSELKQLERENKIEEARNKRDQRISKELAKGQAERATKVKVLREAIDQQDKVDRDEKWKAAADEVANIATGKDKGYLRAAMAKNSDAVVKAYMADPSIIDNKDKVEMVAAIPNLAKEPETLDKLSGNNTLRQAVLNPDVSNQINTVLGRSDKDPLRKLFVKAPDSMTAYYYKNRTNNSKPIGQNSGSSGTNQPNPKPKPGPNPGPQPGPQPPAPSTKTMMGIVNTINNGGSLSSTDTANIQSWVNTLTSQGKAIHKGNSDDVDRDIKNTNASTPEEKGRVVYNYLEQDNKDIIDALIVAGELSKSDAYELLGATL